MILNPVNKLLNDIMNDDGCFHRSVFFCLSFNKDMFEKYDRVEKELRAGGGRWS